MKSKRRNKQSIWKDMTEKAFVKTVSIIELQKNEISALTIDSMINKRLIKGQTTEMELARIENVDNAEKKLSSIISKEVFSSEKPFKFITSIETLLQEKRVVLEEKPKYKRKDRSKSRAKRRSKKKRNKSKKEVLKIESYQSIVFKNPFRESCL